MTWLNSRVRREAGRLTAFFARAILTSASRNPWIVACSAAGDRGDDRQLVAVREPRLEPGARTHVLAVDVHVHEAAQRAVFGEELRPQRRGLHEQAPEHAVHCLPAARQRGLAARVRAKRSGNADPYAHVSPFDWPGPSSRSSWRKGASCPVTSHAVSSPGSPPTTAITSVSSPGQACARSVSEGRAGWSGWLCQKPSRRSPLASARSSAAR